MDQLLVERCFSFRSSRVAMAVINANTFSESVVRRTRKNDVFLRVMNWLLIEVVSGVSLH